MKTIKGEELNGKELEILENGMLRLIEEKSTKYIPKKGATYYYINNFGTVQCRESFISGDEWNINHNIVFRTEKECLEYKDFIKLLEKYKYEPNWENEDELKCYLYYNKLNDCVGMRNNMIVRTQGTFYFKSYEACGEFMNKVGKDNIKRFMFDVWE